MKKTLEALKQKVNVSDKKSFYSLKGGAAIKILETTNEERCNNSGNCTLTENISGCTNSGTC